MGRAGRRPRQGEAQGLARAGLHLRKQPCRSGQGSCRPNVREPWGEGSESRLRGAWRARIPWPARVTEALGSQGGGIGLLPLCKLARGLGPLEVQAGLVCGSGTGEAASELAVSAGSNPPAQLRRTPRGPGAGDDPGLGGGGAPGPPLGANRKTWPLRQHPPEREGTLTGLSDAGGPGSSCCRASADCPSPGPAEQCFPQPWFRFPETT